MSQAFYSEAQIWPWVRDPEFVMFAMNWDDRPDRVMHRRHVDCDREDPHLFTECGRFNETTPPAGGPAPHERRAERRAGDA